MPWIRIEVGASGRLAEAVAEKLSDLGAVAVTYVDDGDSPILEPDPWAVSEPEAWSAVRVAGLFELDTDLGAVRSAFPDRQVDIEFLADDDWRNAWRRFAAVRHFGRLTIVPSTPDSTDADGADAPVPHSTTRETAEGQSSRVMYLDPGLAFGTGSHATTRLCLEWLAAQDMGGRSLLDYGCGSGVLAIAAKLLGAGRVVGVDHDPQALASTRTNAARNGVCLAVEHGAVFLQADELAGGKAEGPFDIVIANIISGTLIALAPRLSRYVAPEGALVLCGVLSNQVDGVMRAYPDFSFRAPTGLEEWMLLHGERV